MMDVEEHSAALSRLTSRMSAVIKFDAGDVHDPFVRVNSFITDLINKLHLLDNVVDMPGVVQRQISIVQKIHKTIEVPQMQVVEKTVEIPQLQVVEQIVEVPEIQGDPGYSDL